MNELSVGIRPELLQHAVGVTLQQHGLDHGEVCLLLTTDDRIQELNRSFRGVDEPTDVLTFPSGEPDPLGDVAISIPYAERQARARGVSLEQELGYLAIHGALHLAGFDDEDEQDRANMVREMNRAAVAAGLAPDEEWSSILHGDPA
ncbi:Metal-dependent hydrolase YbeY, involved in rRNA and/or ribosome maturation and assembly [Fimbriimonas ginsengisoli Gsoil 348]|uniref:Endoribonuclease YbeY n=1 Tax=Fimbriimonas ginsengisoli Gsoil 348 TaxID=661478 RepID=A0A068NJA9_FIMGI|nr:Metal-dependent hydrolase YbeY, involved in rRNA and/or ribosome maturation and assembly [Fimbriimonas ginsengisoli Gsoil 348]